MFNKCFNLGSHQRRCNSTVHTATRRDFISSSLFPQHLGHSYAFSPSSGKISSTGRYLCLPRIAVQVPVPNGRFLTSKSYPHPPRTAGHPLTNFLVVEAICALPGQHGKVLWSISRIPSGKICALMGQWGKIPGPAGGIASGYFWGLQNHCRWWLQPWN